jgi:hypothetical protein
MESLVGKDGNATATASNDNHHHTMCTVHEDTASIARRRLCEATNPPQGIHSTVT